MKQVAVSKFKAQCLALVDHVARTGEELIITKRGRALARVAPVSKPATLEGSVTFLVGDEELIRPIEADWEATR